MSSANDSIERLIGERVHARRKERGRSQQWLANAMRHLGCRWNRRTVMVVETGEREVSVRELIALALCLGTQPTQLLGTLDLAIP